MPLYEYKCQSCGDVFEVIQKFSDQPLTIHEKCGGPVERLISTSALMFKGTGWYVTDYGKGNSKDPDPKPKATANGESSADKSSSKDSSSSDSSAKTESSPSKSESTSTKTESSAPAKSDTK